MTSSLVPHHLVCGLLTLLLGLTDSASTKDVWASRIGHARPRRNVMPQGCDGLVGIPEDHFHFTPAPMQRRSSSATIRGHLLRFPCRCASRIPVCRQHLGRTNQQRSRPSTWTPHGPTLGPNILGSASPATMHRNFTGATEADVYYPAALANQLTENDLRCQCSRHHVQLRKRRQLVLRAGRECAPRRLRFRNGGAARTLPWARVHRQRQLGRQHRVSWTKWIPFVYDTFVNDNNSGGSILDINSEPAPSETPSPVEDSSGRGPRARRHCSPPGIYAPETLGSPAPAFSHLREDMYLTGNANALMTPNLNTGEAIHDPGPIVMGMFPDMGWGVQGCSIIRSLAGSQLSCNPETNTYSQQVDPASTTDAPAGLLNVNGSLFTISGSPKP